MTSWKRLAALVSILLAVAGCTGAADTADGFSLDEWRVDGPGELSASTEVVSITNSGAFPHTMVVTDSSGDVVAATDLIQPGESTRLSLDLGPGTYSFTCRIVAQDPEGNFVDHFESGMNTTVSVTG